MHLSQPIYQLKRRAKLLAREAGIPLHAAQDRIAQTEGFASWSLLSARYAEAARPPSILNGVLQWRATMFAAFHVHAGASS